MKIQTKVVDCLASIYETLIATNDSKLADAESASVFPDVVFEEFNKESSSVRYTGPRWAIGMLAEGLTALEYTVTGFGYQEYTSGPSSKCVINVS